MLVEANDITSFGLFIYTTGRFWMNFNKKARKIDQNHLKKLMLERKLIGIRKIPLSGYFQPENSPRKSERDYMMANRWRSFSSFFCYQNIENTNWVFCFVVTLFHFIIIIICCSQQHLDRVQLHECRLFALLECLHQYHHQANHQHHLKIITIFLSFRMFRIILSFFDKSSLDWNHLPTMAPPRPAIVPATFPATAEPTPAGIANEATINPRKMMTATNFILLILIWFESQRIIQWFEKTDCASFYTVEYALMSLSIIFFCTVSQVAHWIFDFESSDFILRSGHQQRCRYIIIKC